MSNNVTKKTLIEGISNRTGLTQVDTRIVVETFLESIAKSLQEGKNVEIRGFGRFKVKEKRAHGARNPKTGEMVVVDAGFKPVFVASREFRGKVYEAFEKIDKLTYK